jgi:subtilase family serine protease
MYITVTAKNLGMISETFTVKSYYGGNLIGEYTVVDLPTNEEITIVFTWNTSTATPCHNYTISAEASLIPFEYNTTNNVFVDGAVKVRLMCDVDGDGKIDMKDISATAAAFGSFPGHPRWNPDVDFNQDGKVDMKDISFVARRFGKAC